MAEAVHRPEVPEEDVIDLRQIIRILQRRWKIVVAVPVLVVLATLGYLRTAPRIYEAVSILRVQPSTQPLVLTGVPIPMQRQPQQIDLKTIERLITTRLTAQEAIRILKGRRLGTIERLVYANSTVHDALKIARDKVREKERLEELAAEVLMKAVKTKTVEPDLVEIRVRHPDPELAALVANSVAEAMVQRFTREAQRDATQERRYIERSLKTLEEQLRKLEGANSPREKAPRDS
jgi:uncharacterized protein involved in exopolysaccharide biosynthesis